MTRILVTGGRNYANVRLLTRTLDDLARTRAIAVIIHGNAPGADSLAAEWARRSHVPVEAYPADWRRGRGAGPERNARMLAEVRRPPPWKRDLGWVCQDGAAQEGFSHGVACANHTSGAALIVAAVNALPYLLAKVEAAEAMAEAADRVRLDYDKARHPLLPFIRGGDEMQRAAEAYRKAGAP